MRSRYMRWRGLPGHSPGHCHPLPISCKIHTWEHFPFIFVDKEKKNLKKWSEGLPVQKLVNKHACCIHVCIDVHSSTYEPDGKKTWKRKEGKWLNLGIWKTHFPLLYHLSAPFKQVITLTGMYHCSAASPSLPGRTASWSSCHSRICQLLSSEQSKTNTDTSISVSKEAEYMLSKRIYDERPIGFQDNS